MTRNILTILLRAALVTAIMASAALFVDYSSTSSQSFCGVASGCAQVKASSLSHIGPIPLPTIGLGVFCGLFAASLWIASKKHMRRLAAVCVPVALAAMVLIVTQFAVVGAVCKWCMAVDVSAIVAAAVVFALARMGPAEESHAMRFGWAFVGVASLALPLAWQDSAQSTGLPAAVAAQHVKGKVNIVTFTDFQCPHCRRLHPMMHGIIDTDPGRYHLVRMMVPLQSHPGAQPAAKAYLCVPDAIRGKLADKLYAAGVNELTATGVKAFARDLGVDMGLFTECFKSTNTSSTIENHKEIFKNAALKGLPSTFVNDRLLLGADEAKLLEAVDRARRGKSGNDLPWMFATLGVIFAVVAGASLKLRP